jgi:hypothetical protein
LLFFFFFFEWVGNCIISTNLRTKSIRTKIFSQRCECMQCEFGKPKRKQAIIPVDVPECKGDQCTLIAERE